jgi:shikimate dehydrogenase
MNAKRFAVTGDPVAHSASPVMHAAAFRALGLPHTYEAVRSTAAELAGIV